LVVIAIIGVLSTLAVVALGSARQKANDAKRLSDMKQIQTALELYYTDNNAYPTTTSDGMDLGDSSASRCLDSDGFKPIGTCNSSPYMGLVPAGPDTGEAYHFTSGDTNPTSYELIGSLKVGAGGFGIGTVTATESGMIGQTP